MEQTEQMQMFKTRRSIRGRGSNVDWVHRCGPVDCRDNECLGCEIRCRICGNVFRREAFTSAGGRGGRKIVRSDCNKNHGEGCEGRIKEVKQLLRCDTRMAIDYLVNVPHDEWDIDRPGSEETTRGRRKETRKEWVFLLGAQMSRRKLLCDICGRKINTFDEIHKDHYYPLKRGGLDELGNWRLTHDKCNRKKHVNLDRTSLVLHWDRRPVTDFIDPERLA